MEDDFNGMRLEINLILTKVEAEFDLKGPSGIVCCIASKVSRRINNYVSERGWQFGSKAEY